MKEKNYAKTKTRTLTKINQIINEINEEPLVIDKTKIINIAKKEYSQKDNLTNVSNVKIKKKYILLKKMKLMMPKNQLMKNKREKKRNY